MLKHIMLNKKKVPVPLPIRTLGEAVAWVESTLVPEGRTLTRIDLNGRTLERINPAVPLTADSNLSILLDSPLELTVQTLDALRNLIQVMSRGLKPLAVDCWQTMQRGHPENLASLREDLELCLDLYSHLDLLLDARVDRSAMGAAVDELGRLRVMVDMAIADSDWKGVARLLLQKLEPCLEEITREMGRVQKLVFEYQVDQRPRKAGMV